MLHLQCAFPYLFWIVHNDEKLGFTHQFSHMFIKIGIEEKQLFWIATKMIVFWAVKIQINTLSKNLFSFSTCSNVSFYISKLFFPETIIACKLIIIKILFKKIKNRRITYYSESWYYKKFILYHNNFIL